MAYPGRHNIYEAAIRRMVQQALEAQERSFREQHQKDTDQQLLLYLRESAMKLHHTPWPGEITGGGLIRERFGSWDRAVLLARLAAPRGLNQPKNFLRVQEETERQKEIYRRKKAEKKILAQQRIAQKGRKKERKHVICAPPLHRSQIARCSFYWERSCIGSHRPPPIGGYHTSGLFCGKCATQKIHGHAFLFC